MTSDIVLVSEKPGEHTGLIQWIEATGARVLPRGGLDEALPLLEDYGRSAAAIIFDWCSPNRYDLGALTELSLRRPEVQQLVFHPHRFEDADGEALARHPGIHLFRTPLADSSSYQVISNTLQEVFARKMGTAVQSFSSILLPATVPRGAPISLDPGKDSRTEREEPALHSEAFLRRVAAANVPVLLHGETGVGKEVMARRLWAYSARANKPFLKLNCAALPSELIESELFGYEKGAFTGATIDKIGKFEMAQNGTILLDEIGDMDVRLQAKLLQVLQDGEVQPLGSSRIVNVNVRVMAATHRDLRRAIEQGSFREDLYYRLSVINITIPPLRERPSEVLPLASKLLLRHLPEGFPTPVISEALERAMLAYHWPGNVRELENVMRRFLVYQDAELLARELLEDAPEGSSTAPIAARHHASSIDCLAQASREAEAKLLLEALESARWNRRQAALRLNVDYKAFLYKLQKHGIVESKAKRRDVSA
jgi:transcriptional regulator of acetoin/glycerol metabolism